MQTFLSNGKLLLTAEYVVLDGAKALALPTTLGQSLNVETIEGSKIIWNSLDENGKLWYEETFDILNEGVILTSATNQKDNSISIRLIQILSAAKKLNPHFLSATQRFKVTTKLDFPREWGLGTSSTLINNIAQWANVDPYQLLKLTFGGSGYDIACAQHNSPITYQLKNDTPEVFTVDFNPECKAHLYFVYLNKKQDSRTGIAHYKNNMFDLSNTINSINAITEAMLSCTSLDEFERLIQQHETIISKVTNQTKVKDLLFSDFNGSIKSLGAWGGDFILVASKENPKAYFESKGYTTILNYSDIIK